MYHGTKNTKDKSLESTAVIPLSILLKQKKPATIAPWQAYSQLYLKKGTNIYTEIHTDYEDLKAGKEATHSKYSHLFPDLDCKSLSTINWLPFYQVTMMDHIKNISEVELEVVREHIDCQYQWELNIHEQP